MIARFFHADREVGDALARAVRSMPRLLLITQLQGPRNLALEERTPFREILACAGEHLDLVVVIDEGRPEGMWRDPVGDLCDRLFPDRKDAAAATAGYVLAQGGRALTWFRKALWDPLEDAEVITAYVAQLVPGLAPFQRPVAPADPPPRARATPRRTTTPIINPVADAPRAPPRRARSRTPIINPAWTEQRATTEEMPAVEPLRPPRPPPPPEPPPEPPPIDPYRILGLTPGVTFDEARKAWRALVMQYHPDKVAHLAQEFQQLAEAKTRELNAAMAELEKALK